MDISLLKEYLCSEAARGDTVLVEYQSTFPIEWLSWGVLIPGLLERHNVVIIDFFGVGDILFRNYRRRALGKEYTSVLDTMKRVKVVKVGPSTSSYGEVIEEVIPSDDPRTFLKNYHTIVNTIAKLPAKPDYIVSLGLAQFLHFNGRDTLRHMITALATIPLEDWVVVNFINVNAIHGEQLAILEEMSSASFELAGEGSIAKKVNHRARGQ